MKASFRNWLTFWMSLTKVPVMKKILLLLAILISVFAVSAQSVLVGNDNLPVKTAQNISSFGSPDGIAESISVYPNPVVDVLKVAFKSNRNTIASISLFNNIGKQTYNLESEVQPGNNIVPIDIIGNGIGSGIYFVQIKIGKDIVTRKLIVK